MKRLLALILATMMATSVCSATYEVEYSTQIDYLLAANYTIEIPSYIDLNDNRVVTVRAYNVDLPDGEELVVGIDPVKSAITDDVLTLNAQDNDKTIDCNVTVMSGNDENAELVTSLYGNDYVIAVFGSGDNELKQFGGIYINPVKDTAKRGHYSGNLYYTVEVKGYM